MNKVFGKVPGVIIGIWFLVYFWLAILAMFFPRIRENEFIVKYIAGPPFIFSLICLIVMWIAKRINR